MNNKISAYIIAKNEEQKIKNAIESVKWADEIIVIDSGSSDKTIEISEKCGAIVFHHEFTNFTEQKNYALAKCNFDWTFNLDADEEVSAELGKAIANVVELNIENAKDTYKVSRKTNYMGKWINHCGWYPEYRTRLSKKDKAYWKGEMIHESLFSENEFGMLSGDLYHRPYNNLNDHIDTIKTYSRIWAERENSKGRNASLLDIIFRPIIKFFKMYFLKAGFLDGIVGLIISVMGAWYVFIKYARLFEISRESVK